MCHGKLSQQLVTYTQWYEGRLFVIENVPAWVCEQGGDTYDDPDVVERVQALIWSGAEPVRVIEAPVYDLSAVLISTRSGSGCTTLTICAIMFTNRAEDWPYW